MSGVAIVRHILANNATLNAAIPPERITAGVAPIGTELPAISITQVSGVSPFDPVDAPGNMIRERVQVTVEAKKYAQVKSIMSMVRSAFTTYSRGTVNGIACDSVMQDNDGPDLMDPDTEIYSQSTDFIVRWISL